MTTTAAELRSRGWVTGARMMAVVTTTSIINTFSCYFLVFFVYGQRAWYIGKAVEGADLS